MQITGINKREEKSLDRADRKEKRMLMEERFSSDTHRYICETLRNLSEDTCFPTVLMTHD